MNIMEYRAMKAQEEAEKNALPQGSESHAQTQQVSTEPVQPSVQETTPAEPTPNQESGETLAQGEPSQTQVFEINGQQVSLEELQNGYLRQSDYTRKTQEIARKERELQDARAVYEAVQQNPEVAQSIGFDPQEAHIRQMEAELFDYRLQQELSTLSTKYADFNEQEVIQFALDRQMENLEDAYLLNKQYKGFVPSQVNTPVSQAPIDVEALKAQIRAELLAEQNTSTIISGGGNPPQPEATVQLSDAEKRVARMMKLSDEDYAKWRDIN